MLSSANPLIFGGFSQSQEETLYKYFMQCKSVHCPAIVCAARDILSRRLDRPFVLTFTPISIAFDFIFNHTPLVLPRKHSHTVSSVADVSVFLSSLASPISTSAYCLLIREQHRFIAATSRIKSNVSSLVSADLGKATLFPEGLHDPLNALDHSYDPPNSWVNVAAPQLCKQHAQDAGCNVNAVQARSVKYGDCSTPWTICRCDNANMNMDDIMYRFGEIPVGIRSYVGSALATRASGCSAGSGGDFIVFNGDCAESVFIHEASHSLDQGASQTSGWNDAIARSSCVPDPYANSSPAEDFAQVNVLFTYQCHIGSLPRDPACLQPQLNYFYDNSRINVVQGTSTCFPDKRPFTLSAASAKFVPGASKTVPYVPIKPTYTAVPSFNTTA